MTLLDVNQVERLGRLAKIKLTDLEKKNLSKDLSSILDYVEKLQAVKLDKKPNFSEFIADDSLLRTDEVYGVSAEEASELIESFPDREKRLIKTKPIFK